VTKSVWSQAKAPLDLFMGNAFACIKLGKASVDPRKKHQTLDRVVERGVIGQILKSLEDSVSRRWTRHIAVF
jgi:hypothetical protein